MKMIRGGAPGANAAEMWTAIRDNPHLAAPIMPSEVASTADIHAPMPPSRAHLKRLAPRKPFVEVVPRQPVSEKALQSRRQLDFHKRVLAELGGTRTIVGSDVPDVPKAKVYIEPSRELDRREARPKTNLKLREHVEALRKMLYTEHQEDWVQNMEAGLL